MIKTFVKHYIYELCINVFFDKLIKNFPINPIPFRVGEYINSIFIRTNTGRYVQLFACKVVEFTENTLKLTSDASIDYGIGDIVGDIYLDINNLKMSHHPQQMKLIEITWIEDMDRFYANTLSSDKIQ